MSPDESDLDLKSSVVGTVNLTTGWPSFRRSCSSRRSLSRMPSCPSSSGDDVRRYGSSPPFCLGLGPGHALKDRLTFLMVRSARVVSLTLTKPSPPSCSSPPSISEGKRFCCTLGSHVRRVLWCEKGTLLPYCLVRPWKRPDCARLNGCETVSRTELVGRIGL